MNITKELKLLLSDSYQLESELTDIIKQCFEEIFKDQGSYAYSIFKDDLLNGRENCGCLQGLNYYKQLIAENEKRIAEYKQKENK